MLYSLWCGWEILPFLFCFSLHRFAWRDWRNEGVQRSLRNKNGKREERHKLGASRGEKFSQELRGNATKCSLVTCNCVFKKSFWLCRKRTSLSNTSKPFMKSMRTGCFTKLTRDLALSLSLSHPPPPSLSLYNPSLFEKVSFLFHRSVPASIKDVPVLVLTCDEEFESSPERQKEMLKEVEKFVASLK